MEGFRPYAGGNPRIKLFHELFYKHDYGGSPGDYRRKCVVANAGNGFDSGGVHMRLD